MKAQTTPAGVLVTLEPVEALKLLEDLEKFDVEAHPDMATAHLYRAIREACSARVPSDRPAPAVDHTEPEPSGRSADVGLPPHGIPPEHLEWAIRVYQCDHSGTRAPNESKVFNFPNEARARDFFGRTQQVHNAKVRGGEADAYDVVLGVQDKRPHKKRKGNFHEVEHALCKGGPG